MVDREIEEQTIRENIRVWVDLAQARDATAIVQQFYAPDAKLLVPHAPMIEGQDQIIAFYEAIFDLPDASLSMAPVMVEVAEGGDMALDLGTYTLTYDSPEGIVEDRGKYLIVWKKRDGRWKVIADSPNSDLSQD